MVIMTVMNQTFTSVWTLWVALEALRKCKQWCFRTRYLKLPWSLMKQVISVPLQEMHMENAKAFWREKKEPWVCDSSCTIYCFMQETFTYNSNWHQNNWVQHFKFTSKYWKKVKVRVCHWYSIQVYSLEKAKF